MNVGLVIKRNVKILLLTKCCHWMKMTVLSGVHQGEWGQGHVIPFPAGLPTLQGDILLVFVTVALLWDIGGISTGWNTCRELRRRFLLSISVTVCFPLWNSCVRDCDRAFRGWSLQPALQPRSNWTEASAEHNPNSFTACATCRKPAHRNTRTQYCSKLTPSKLTNLFEPELLLC